MSYKQKTIVIIGAGVAAISLAATLKVASIPFIILEKSSDVGGILPEIHNEIDDFIVGTFANGLEMSKRVSDFIKEYKIEIRYNCDVTGIDIENNEIYYKYLDAEMVLNFDIAVIATGSRFKIDVRFLDTDFREDLYYRISHNLSDFVGKNVVVVGGGDNATVAALRLSSMANKIYLINKNNSWNSRKDLIEKINENSKIEIFTNAQLTNLSGDNRVKIADIQSADGVLKLSIDKVVFKIGYLPNSEFVGLSLNLDKKGYINTFNNYMTSVANVYAIGDIVSSSYKRIAIAMGQGVDLGNHLIWNVL